MGNRIKIKNKDYVGRSTCNCYLLYSSDTIDEEGNSIPLDINGKRHFCNAVQQLAHEELVLKDVQNRLAFVNKVEFSSIQLGIVDVTDQVS
jgi:hypothetical protein